jgi:hypothetical protein
METIRGVVGNLHASDGSSIATFLIDGVAIQISASAPPVLAEGDDVSVIGMRKSGILVAYAYLNHTQGVQGSARARTMLIFSSAFMLLTLAIGAGLRAWNNANTALVISVLFAGGLAYFVLALRMRQAERELFRRSW